MKKQKSIIDTFQRTEQETLEQAKLLKENGFDWKKILLVTETQKTKIDKQLKHIR